ncbi:DUF5615 family PIN-like protein [Myxacorys almedinensis]|uniref:DUF5615 domain-containing protein n=1 Tax=Myxacorys almedinensis A TaxID=2690445 RepID=A0A8J8CKZ5_9CYAN|nr:DUF5615 family PIN-like protein [Myxacorys almedinensis]NDJ20014.1 hypothetical protein [Myxacorys almedinensis A]
MVRYLIDENLPPSYQMQLLRRKPDITVWAVGDPGTPPKGMLDPVILEWCEQHDFILITNNRRSMPIHLVEHLDCGQHIPGIFALRPKASLGEILDDLILIAEVDAIAEFYDRIVYIPL